MGTTTVEPEALRALANDIGSWVVGALGVVVQAAAAVEATHSEAESMVRQRAARLAALEATPGGDGVERSSRAREIARARTSLEQARTALRVAAQCLSDVRSLERRIRSVESDVVENAVADLGVKLKALEAYRAVTPPDAGGVGQAPAAPQQMAAYSAFGLENVSLGKVDFSDNPVEGAYGKGGASLTDYRWAVETWATVVGPGVAAGLGREAFEERDSREGRVGLRRLGGVYDLFLGDDRIVYSRRPDGSLDVINGRHRIEVARSLGIEQLPGKIHG